MCETSASTVIRKLHDFTTQQHESVLVDQAVATFKWLENFLAEARSLLTRDEEVNILVPRTPGPTRKRRMIYSDDSSPVMSERCPSREGRALKSTACTSDDVSEVIVSFARPEQCASPAKATEESLKRTASRRSSRRSDQFAGNTGGRQAVGTAGVFDLEKASSRTGSMTCATDSSLKDRTMPFCEEADHRPGNYSFNIIKQSPSDCTIAQGGPYLRSRVTSPSQMVLQQTSPCLSVPCNAPAQLVLQQTSPSSSMTCSAANENCHRPVLSSSKKVVNGSPTVCEQPPAMEEEETDEGTGTSDIGTPPLISPSSSVEPLSNEILVNEQTFTVDETEHEPCSDAENIVAAVSSCTDDEKDETLSKSTNSIHATPPPRVVKAKPEPVATSSRVLRSTSRSTQKRTPPLRLTTTLLPKGRFACTPIERSALQSEIEDSSMDHGKQEPKVLRKLANLATCKSFIRQPTPKKVDAKVRQAQLKEAVENKKKQAEERQRQQEERRQQELEEKKQKREERQRLALKRKAEMDEERAAKLRKRQLNQAPKQKVKEETRRPDQQRQMQLEVKQRLAEEQKQQQAKERLGQMDMSSQAIASTRPDNHSVSVDTAAVRSGMRTVTSAGEHATMTSPPLQHHAPAKSSGLVLKELDINVSKIPMSQPAKPALSKGRFFSPTQIAPLALSKPAALGSSVKSIAGLESVTSSAGGPITTSKLMRPLTTMDSNKPSTKTSVSISQTPPRPFIGHPVASSIGRSASSTVMSPPPIPPMPTPPGPSATYDNYDINNLTESESTDDEDSPRRPIPGWARNGPIKAACWNQDRFGPKGEDVFPPSEIETPNLMRIFSNKPRSRYVEHRGSSACWNSPLVKQLRMA